jgi:hypothetical protein
MMERPQVRVVQDQQIETTVRQADGYEAEEILRRYGYSQQSQNISSPPQQQDTGLSFEQMVAQQEAREKEEKMRQHQKMYGPKPVTFDGRNGYTSEVKYGSDDELGFGFRIEITTNMNLPK